MKLSLMTLGDVSTDPVTGERQSAQERHRSIIEAAAAAEAAGFYGVHIGEHHGLDYITSTPPVLLAAIAERTSTLRLSTSVTLAANLDPVRAAEDYATLDLISNGRAEMVAGRGNFFETTYQLFGQDPADSHEMFAENIELMLELWAGKPVTWTSRHRAPINDFTLQPTPTRVLPVWIGGGASLSTTELAARNGLNLMLPSAFGEPNVFRPTADKYRELFTEAGFTHQPMVGACWHVNVDKDSARARERWAPRYQTYFALSADNIRKTNPNPPTFINKPFDFDWLTTRGPAIVGSPAEVVDRLGAVSASLGSDLNLISIDMGGLPQSELLTMIELIGSDVIPQLP